ncbi:hypothetical protein F5X68DRAFT_279774 [Plectosphaerella plurivora]|uniref:Uncharacterized protein n=1 Tax=Plectosphaerella plurivora TaxID=936078 RepID=A0A9P8V166_9PEZI|nr:hypothetical protein F5X68DRAFT_279774 [Plectosphaerella plurivora]
MPAPNSTYDLSFWGPSYQCADLDEFVGNKGEPTWNTNEFPYASVFDAFTETIQLDNDDLYRAEAPEYMPNSIMINSIDKRGTSGVKIICQLYNTPYSISVQFLDGVQSVVPRSIRPLKWQTGSYAGGNAAPLSSNFASEGYPTSFYITKMLFEALLVVSIGQPASATGQPVISESGKATGLGQSSLVFCPEISSLVDDFFEMNQTERCRNGSLALAVEDLSHNFTYSTIPYFQEINSVTVGMTTWLSENYFVYDRMTLFLAYGVGFVAALTCLLIGVVALCGNGYAGTADFSSILLTTRNADLDQLAQGRFLGSKSSAMEIGPVKVRFGRLQSQDGTYRAGFGLDGTVEPLRKGT